MTSQNRKIPKKHPLYLLILILFIVSGCARAGDKVTYQPDPGDIDLAAWAEQYPEIYEEWERSIHGQTYLTGDTNAATCNDCHTDPASGEIHAAEFRLEVPLRCARCHDDASLMAEYQVADDVYETYLADFHGTTISFYQMTDPTALRDEAVCSDCHGSHAIYPPDDKRSSAFEANLQQTCQKCHPGAEEAFASAYGHYRPIQSPVTSADKPIVFIVKLFYQAMIPVTLGGMIGYIALDVRHRMKNKPANEDNEENA